jgi:hypothetical protein
MELAEAVSGVVCRDAAGPFSVKEPLNNAVLRSQAALKRAFLSEVCRLDGCVWAVWPAPASCGRKPPAGEIQIGDARQREHLCAVLGDAAIAHLAVAELAFHDAEDVLEQPTSVVSATDNLTFGSRALQ